MSALSGIIFHAVGMAVALGLTAATGTLVPPIYEGKFLSLFETTGGIAQVTGCS